MADFKGDCSLKLTVNTRLHFLIYFLLNSFSAFMTVKYYLNLHENLPTSKNLNSL